MALKPQKLSYAQAASIPLCSLTAWQSLQDTAHIKKNEQVLIHAGAGGVGGFAIQFAKLAGAKVITTASQIHYDYVKKLGAETVIDYTKEDFVEKIKKLSPQGLDMIFDTVGGDTLKKSYDITKAGGRLVSIAGVVDNTLAQQKKIHADYIFVNPNGEELTHIAHLLDEGKLFPPHIEELPLNEVKTALHKSREGHTEGKIVLKIK